ncbi:MAG: hypothetical protein IPI17_12610 [Nitrosomonas sp.]|jgi:prophage antirepressor-like protein|nr:hypothetical protein [Nitrosomonas sp.]
MKTRTVHCAAIQHIKDKEGNTWFTAEHITRALGYKNVLEVLHSCLTTIEISTMVKRTRGRNSRLALNAQAARQIAVQSFAHWNAEMIFNIINRIDSSTGSVAMPKLA